MGIAILVVMAVGVALMLTRRLPTAFALALMGVAIALVVGAPITGDEGSVLVTVLQEGPVLLAATMIAILLGSWLGALLGDTGIASTLIRKTVEFAGDKPYVVAFGVFIVAILCGAVTGSAPAAMLAGIVGIPTMIAVGVHARAAAGTVLMGLGAGIPLELTGWQYLSDALRIPVEVVRDFQIRLFPIVVGVGLVYVFVQSRRRGLVHSWAMKVSGAQEPPGEDLRSRGRRVGDVAWYALPTPLVPLVLALGLEVPIIPALLAGVLYALLTTTRFSQIPRRALRTLYRCFDVAAPPIVLFLAIGILLAAVRLPGAVEALDPILGAVSPTLPILFVVVFAVLAPLALYRGRPTSTGSARESAVSSPWAGCIRYPPCSG